MKKYEYSIDIAAQDAPAKILRSIGHHKRVLEVGCGSGMQTRLMKEQYGCSVVGIEIDPAAAEQAAPYCESLHVGDLDTLDLDRALRRAKFDVVVCADVLEHLKHPLRVLTALRHYIAADGFLLASIPNVAHASVALELANGRFNYRRYGLLDDTHLRFFTLDSVTRLFQSAGLSIASMDRVERGPDATEFYTGPFSADEQAVLAFCRKHNPEHSTYQFIVRAFPDPRAAPRWDARPLPARVMARLMSLIT